MGYTHHDGVNTNNLVVNTKATVPTPVDTTDAATKAYVDAHTGGSSSGVVLLAATADQTITGAKLLINSGGFQGPIDGIVGGTTPAAVTGTTITANTGFVGPINGIVGGTTPAAVTATTVTANTSLTVATGGTAAVTDADKLTVGGLKIPQQLIVTEGVQGTTAATSTNYGCFFIADRAYTVAVIKEAHSTAGTDSGTVSLDVQKCTGTQAPGSGVTLLNAAINLKGTANTVQTPTLTATSANLDLAAGDRLALATTGTLTALAGVQVTVILKLK